MRAQIADTFNFLSKLTFKRVQNYFLLVFSYYQSKKSKIPQQKGLPFSIAIEPTTSCNLRCPECPSGLRSFTRPKGMLVPELFSKILQELTPTLTYLTFYFQGEPYLHPDFLNLVKLADEKNIYTATSTNAHFLSDSNAKKTVESGLDRLIISIDGTTQETYEKYRVGGSLEKTLAGTKNIVKWKKALKSKKPYLIFQFLLVRHNEHQTEEVKRLAKAIGVDEVKFKTAQINDFASGSDLIPENPAFSRYKKNIDGSYSIKNKLENSCWKMWSSCVITWDGRVVPCCFDKDADFVLGKLNAESFNTIWQGKAYNAFRKNLLESRSNIEMCKNCSEGTKVWA